MKWKKKDFGIFETEFIANQPEYQFTILQRPNTKTETDRTYGFSKDKYKEVKIMLDNLPSEFEPKLFAVELEKLGIEPMGIGRFIV
tara:strand:+ start:230 stop:487 length:258 start_codon:yes stop_codon:yes gene_type:complete